MFANDETNFYARQTEKGERPKAALGRTVQFAGKSFHCRFQNTYRLQFSPEHETFPVKIIRVRLCKHLEHNFPVRFVLASKRYSRHYVTAGKK